MKKFAALVSLLLLVSGSVSAQTQTPPSSPSPQTCAKPESNNSAKQNEPLGDKLADSKGVICPPPTNDTGANVAPPDTGAKMPVIKPAPNAK